MSASQVLTTTNSVERPQENIYEPLPTKPVPSNVLTGLKPIDHALLKVFEQLKALTTEAQKYFHRLGLLRDYGVCTVESELSTFRAVALESASVSVANTAIKEATAKLIESAAELNAATATYTEANAKLTEREATSDWLRKVMSSQRRQQGESKTGSHEFSG